jgi:hypothetical protein
MQEGKSINNIYDRIWGWLWLGVGLQNEPNLGLSGGDCVRCTQIPGLEDSSWGTGILGNMAVGD